MNKHLSREELQQLLEHRAAHCVSIYLPTHRSGEETKQSPIHLKNLLAEAQQQLEAKGLKSHQAETLLEPARALINDELSWQHRREGLALFLDAEGLRQYSLPQTFEPLAVVGEWFEILPLLPLLALGDRYYILALSGEHVRLLEATRHNVSEVEVPNMPRNQAEALAHDDREESLQFHTGSDAQGGGHRPAVFHGQGRGSDTDKLDRFRYFQRIDRALSRYLADEQAPLVLAAVNSEQSIYRETNHYPHLIAHGLDGNPDQLTAEELRDGCWPLVEPSFHEAEREAKARLGELRTTERAMDTVERLVPAAYWGQVDTLFVERDQHVWGQFDPSANRVHLSDQEEPEAGDYDLLDLAVRRTLAKGGTVFALRSERMPVRSPAAAICRY